MNAGRLNIILIPAFLSLALQTASGSPAAVAVRQGNKLYADGRYNEAIKKYDEALVESPQALEPKFDKAASYFRLDDTAPAIELYKQAAAESRNMSLVAKAKYNLGNCYFVEGTKQKDSDLQKALDDMRTGIENWRAVLEIEPDNEKAAKNIEVAQLTIKDIMDRIHKQQQKQKQQAQKQKKLADKLKQLYEQQKQLADKTGRTKQQVDANDISRQQASWDYNDIAEQQSQLRDKTEQTLDRIQQDPNLAQQPQAQQAAKELGSAAQKQSDAEKQLKEPSSGQAKQSQDKAAEHIENAIKSLSGRQGQNQQQKQQQQGRQQQEPNQPAEPNRPQEPNQPQQQQQAAAPDETAQEILDKEQRQHKQRQMLQNAGYQKVDKDW